MPILNPQVCYLPCWMHWLRILKALAGGVSLLVALDDGLSFPDMPACELIPEWKTDPQKSKGLSAEGNKFCSQNRNRFLSELRFIDKVDVIKTRHIGIPAGTDRDVIDNSWNFSLVLTFDSKKDQDIYQEHEFHLAFKERASSFWNRVLVYDSVKVE